MLGAIAGDIIGSVYERQNIKTTNFPLFSPQSRFTDDTVLTVAIAAAILKKTEYATTLKQFGLKYPDAGYGKSFMKWIQSPVNDPYNSWGNGSAMRVSPVGFAFSTVEAVLDEAQKTAAVTHNHAEGIKGAQATALAVFLARTENSKETIRAQISQRFQYNLNRTVEDIRPGYQFDVSCQGSVPEAIIAFLDSSDYEDAIRKAVSLGGDSDTLACIAGGIAEAFYGEVPEAIAAQVQQRLPTELLETLMQFQQCYR